MGEQSLRDADVLDIIASAPAVNRRPGTPQAQSAPSPTVTPWETAERSRHARRMRNKGNECFRGVFSLRSCRTLQKNTGTGVVPRAGWILNILVEFGLRIIQQKRHLAEPVLRSLGRTSMARTGLLKARVATYSIRRRTVKAFAASSCAIDVGGTFPLSLTTRDSPSGRLRRGPR